MNTNFSILFYAKRSKATVDGLVPIYYRVTIDGQRIELSTQRYIQPDKWSTEGNRAKGTTAEAKEINTYLDAIKSKIYDYQQQLIRDDKQVNAENMRNKILGIEKRRYMLIPIFQQHNREMEALIGREYAQATLSRFTNLLRHIKGYLRWKFNTSDIDIRDINHEFLTGFEFYLKSEQHCAHNTVAKQMMEFGKIIRICLANEWITRNPFYNYKCRKKEVERPFLNQEEIDAIRNKSFPMDRLNQVKDVFVFCCYTGLAYVDVHKLTSNHIRMGVDGTHWIFINRSKTETRSSIPILPVAASIIEKYQNHPQTVNTGKLLPVLSNQKTNSYLKEIADLCGITKELTFHVARHTFATTVTLRNGVSIESVSKMLGHRDIRTTQHYAKILDIKVGEDMHFLRKRLAAIKPSKDKPIHVAKIVNF